MRAWKRSSQVEAWLSVQRLLCCLRYDSWSRWESPEIMYERSVWTHFKDWERDKRSRRDLFWITYQSLDSMNLRLSSVNVSSKISFSRRLQVPSEKLSHSKRWNHISLPKRSDSNSWHAKILFQLVNQTKGKKERKSLVLQLEMNRMSKDKSHLHFHFQYLQKRSWKLKAEG